jgi:recombinational DNA repair protein RecR
MLTFNKHCSECGCLDTKDNPVCDIIDNATGMTDYLCVICLAKEIDERH